MMIRPPCYYNVRYRSVFALETATTMHLFCYNILLRVWYLLREFDANVDSQLKQNKSFMSALHCDPEIKDIQNRKRNTLM
jgi:hypothetical protein